MEMFHYSPFFIHLFNTEFNEKILCWGELFFYEKSWASSIYNRVKGIGLLPHFKI